MNDLIKFKDGKLDAQTICYILSVEMKMQALKEQYDAFKADLLTAMEQNGIVKYEDNNVRINYVAATQRETFDSKAFKADMPELYDEYVKFSNVKPSVRISVK